MTEKKIEYIPLTSDYMFKKVFIENPNILKKLLISVLKLNMNPDISELRFLNTELPKSRKKEYRKTVDILVSIDDKKIIDVEINTENYNDIKLRNTLYIEKIISMGVEKNTNYQDMNNYYFYQLNLNTKGHSNYFKDKYFTYKEKFTNEILTSNIEIIYKSLDYYRDIYYNKNEQVSNDVLWLLLIRSETFEELEKIAKLLIKKQEYQKFIKSVRDGCMEEMSIANWEADKMEALVRATAEKNRKKELEEAIEQGTKLGIEQGTKLGIEQGTKLGIEQGTKILVEKVIKNLLKKKMSYQEIAEISGQSIEKVKNIEKMMKESKKR